jgi:putative membrane-bound dehydrogenase-like protein
MLRTLFTFVAISLFCVAAFAQQKEVIPHAQDKPPGPALSPEEAIKKMTVPEGFSVELVASEPDIVNPVAMTIDERGRFWITESFEYPRREAGPGKDRVKVLEDTDGDGKADKFTVFAEGLNIPSGVAVGYGGVWVANSPDILFMQDTDGDGKADKSEVVVTGFGRDDTHELPNSLTWGPDGWLYGLNGVFNRSHVKYPESSPHYKKDHPGWQFTCALFRIHPKTREFQVWCEGTSNPWGVAFDNDGSAFISACVIDHLWHLTETGYYHRQGGPYPPFTWKIESIVKHKHQKAAYCGIHYFDSDAYPEKYRNKLYMGNIHGGCINCDRLERDGSTYAGKLEPDFLTANDAWFMPVVQKTGPDGSLYVLDWYDRYHCYQDANRDPKGIDRLKGRLYRVRYKETPRAVGFDLGKESDEELIKRLGAGNDFIRNTAQRLLVERLSAAKPAAKERDTINERETIKALDTFGTLTELSSDQKAPRQQRLHAIWTIIGSGYPPSIFPIQTLYMAYLHDKDPTIRAWGVRAMCDQPGVGEAFAKQILDLTNDPSADVKLQVAIAATKKLKGADAVQVLMHVLRNSGEDKLIPHIVWQNLHPLLEQQGPAFIAAASQIDEAKVPAMREIMPRAIDRILAAQKPDPVAIATIFATLSGGEKPNPALAGKCLAVLAERVQSRELAGEQLAALKNKLQEPVAKVLQGGPSSPLYFDAALLATSWKNEDAIQVARDIAADRALFRARRVQAIDALITAGDKEVLDVVHKILGSRELEDLAVRGQVISALARLDDPTVAPMLINVYEALDAEQKPRVIEVLTARANWSKALLSAIEKKQIPADALNANQVRKLLSLGDKDVAALVKKNWGSIRTERDPAREQLVADMRTLIRKTPGDPAKGQELYKKLCGQCHKIYGEGQEVGPDITVNGRSSFEQLLSNVFDPSLVIGASYQARTVVTTDGRVLTGLAVEDNDQRIVLKLQGGKLETIARKDVDEVNVSPLSLMPEGIEKQYKPQEIADLFAFLTLDKPPSDPSARKIPGTIEPKPRTIEDPAKYGEILDETLPGWKVERSGLGGVTLLGEHQGRTFVVRTHPIDKGKPCVLSRKIEVPAGKKSRLELAVSHHADPPGDWQLVVKIDGKEVQTKLISQKSGEKGWTETFVDLTPYAGKTINVELLNQPNDWNYEYGYWARAEVISQ